MSPVATSYSQGSPPADSWQNDPVIDEKSMVKESWQKDEEILNSVLQAFSDFRETEQEGLKAEAVRQEAMAEWQKDEAINLRREEVLADAMKEHDVREKELLAQDTMLIQQMLARAAAKKPLGELVKKYRGSARDSAKAATNALSLRLLEQQWRDIHTREAELQDTLDAAVERKDRRMQGALQDQLGELFVRREKIRKHIERLDEGRAQDLYRELYLKKD